MVKIRSKREIDLMIVSNQIVAETLDLVSQFVEPGTPLKKLDSLAEEHIRSQDGRPAFKGYLGYPATLCISIDDVVVHGIPNGDILKEGQIVSIDCGVEKNGYYGDHARTFAVGEIDPDKQELMNTTRESLDIGIGYAIEGNYVSDIGHAIQSFVEARGYSVVRELVGHGIGTELHEEPQVPNFGQPKKGLRLKTGMCLAIEPMINMGSKDVFTDKDGWTVRTKDGKPSAHFEHTIAVLDNGPIVLSQRKNHA
jgi:methionyl aminopeptidase